MQRQIDNELNALRQFMLSMGAAVEKSIEAATDGLIERNAEHLDKVRAFEDEINAYHLQVDEKFRSRVKKRPMQFHTGCA